MPTRLRLFYSGLMAALLMIPLVALYRDLAARSDIWWTPMPMALSLAEARDRVEIYAQGQRLDSLLSRTQLSIADPAGPRVLAAEDVRLRFNNWDRVRVGRMSRFLANAAACGGVIVLLVLVATGRLAYRGEKDPIR